MPNPLIWKGKYLFHITHISNVAGILKKDLLCKNQAEAKSIKYKDVSNAEVQLGRSCICVPPGSSTTLHDYVPLFFGARPAMLYAVRRQGTPQEEMIYLLVRWNVIELKTTWFTDGNARSHATKFYDDLKDLNQLNWAAVEAVYWGDKGEEYKRQKQAEVLKRDSVTMNDIVGFCVYNDAAKERLQMILSKQGVDRKIFIVPEFYYP